MIIKKNTHAPFRLPKFYLEHTPIRYEVEFTESCRYRFGTDDDNDVNKLFGVAFITWGSVWHTLKSIWNVVKKRDLREFKSLHHYNSIRYGNRYDAFTDSIEYLEYGYKNGERFINHIYSKHILEKVFLGLTPIDRKDGSVFYILLFNGISFANNYDYPENCIMYELHPYFGGNRKAPHDMEIKLKRL